MCTTVYLPCFARILSGFLPIVLLSAFVEASATDSEFIDLGWRHTAEHAAHWRPEPWRVANPDAHAASHPEADVVTFRISAPGSAMAWTLTLNPIWVTDFPFLECVLETSSAVEESDAPLLWLGDGSTGPVTPGANNPENPLSSGGSAGVGRAKPGEQRIVLDLRAHLASDRIAEITLFARSGEAPLTVTLKRLAFWAENPDAPATVRPAAVEASPFTAASTSAMAFAPATLPVDGVVDAASLLRAFGLEGPWPEESFVTVEGLPFHLGSAAHAAVATHVMDREDIRLQPQTGAALALLLGARIFGSGAPWYSKNSTATRDRLTSPHELVVETEYMDGVTVRSFPRRAPAGQPEVARGIHAYWVPLQTGKAVKGVRLLDGMDYVQVFLLAASTLETFPGDSPAASPLSQDASALQASETTLRHDTATGILELGNASLRLALDTKDGSLQKLTLPALGRSVAENGGALLRVQHADGAEVPLELQEVKVEADSAHLTWAMAGTACALHLALRLGAGSDLVLSVTIRNGGNEAWAGSLTCPDLRACAVSGGGPVDYVLGTRTATLDSAPRTVDEVYGGRFPLQFMDIYDARDGGGLALRIEDSELTRKWFQFSHDEAEMSNMAIGYRQLTLAPGEARSFPPVVLTAHEGDWRAPFAAYRQWARSALPAPKPSTMSDMFFCRRDYPLGGTGYLFDLRARAYTFGRLIEESVEAFGSVDLVDLSSWAYHEEAGRVGDYLTNELGGLEALRAGVEEAHGKGTRAGFYFEGYLIDRRCPLAGQANPAWQLIGANGEGRWWSGGMELFCCPGVAAWRGALAQSVAEVAGVTGVDAVYLDQLGICDESKACWSPNHGHEVPSNPLREEVKMIQAVRGALAERGLDTAIYIEHMPCDAMSGLVDGVFNAGLLQPGAVSGPTKLPLHRYLYPEVAIFEMLAHGIRPIPAGAGDMHLAMFHGLGLWLKGRAASWFSPALCALAQNYQKVCQNYGGLLRAPDCVPHVDTLRPGVYANRFGSGERYLLTLYNSTPDTVEGAMIALELSGGSRIWDLLADMAVEPHSGMPGTAQVHCVLEPHTTAMFLIEGIKPAKE